MGISLDRAPDCGGRGGLGWRSHLCSNVFLFSLDTGPKTGTIGAVKSKVHVWYPWALLGMEDSVVRICGRCLLALAVALGLAGSARADLYPSPELYPSVGGGSGSSYLFYIVQTGDAVSGGSWAVPLHAFSTVGSIDLLAVRIFSDPFGDPAFTEFSVEGWDQILNNGTLAAASGPGVGSMLFNLNFSGDMATPIEFDVVAFSGDTLMGSMHGSWDGVGPFIYFSGGNWSPTRSSLVAAAVPAPGATALAVLGLGLVGVIRRRFA